MKVKIVNNSNNPLPFYSTNGSAGMDIRAFIPNSVTIEPFERVLIPTGLHVSLPTGCEIQIRPRSGMALKHGITVLNTPGTIDSDYRGDIGVILINLSDTPYTVYNGDRIAQMVVNVYENVDWEEIDSLSDTERGEGGFGHTGIK